MVTTSIASWSSGRDKQLLESDGIDRPCDPGQDCERLPEETQLCASLTRPSAATFRGRNFHRNRRRPAARADVHDTAASGSEDTWPPEQARQAACRWPRRLLHRRAGKSAILSGSISEAARNTSLKPAITASDSGEAGLEARFASFSRICTLRGYFKGARYGK